MVITLEIYVSHPRVKHVVIVGYGKAYIIASWVELLGHLADQALLARLKRNLFCFSHMPQATPQVIQKKPGLVKHAHTHANTHAHASMHAAQKQGSPV